MYGVSNAMLKPMYTMCMKCQEQGQMSMHTRKICKDKTEEVNQLGNEEQDLSEWLIDSGASVHLTKNRTWTNDPSHNNWQLEFNGGKVNWRSKTTLRDLNRNVLKLEQTLFIPSFKKKIISLSKLLNQGYQVRTWMKEYFDLSKGMMRMNIWRKEGHTTYYFHGTITRNKEIYMVKQLMEINKAHNKLAHMGEAVLWKTMKNYSMRLTGKLLPCNTCMRAKAHAKYIKKMTEKYSNKGWRKIVPRCNQAIQTVDQRNVIRCKDSQPILKEDMEWTHKV